LVKNITGFIKTINEEVKSSQALNEKVEGPKHIDVVVKEKS